MVLLLLLLPQLVISATHLVRANDVDTLVSLVFRYTPYSNDQHPITLATSSTAAATDDTWLEQLEVTCFHHSVAGVASAGAENWNCTVDGLVPQVRLVEAPQVSCEPRYQNCWLYLELEWIIPATATATTPVPLPPDIDPLSPLGFIFIIFVSFLLLIAAAAINPVRS